LKITSISFTKTVQINNYVWDKVGADASLEENEDPKEALTSLKSFVEGHFNEIESMRGTHVRDIPAEPKDKGTIEDNYISAIADCRDIKVLKTFEKLANDTYPKFRAAYNQKLKTLQ